MFYKKGCRVLAVRSGVERMVLIISSWNETNLSELKILDIAGKIGVIEFAKVLWSKL
jgi:hypothetical protein